MITSSLLGVQGISEERPGLLETAARSRGHYQKRAYACVKLVVGVMCRAPAAVRAVHARPDARRRWRQLLAWLQDELDRVSSYVFSINRHYFIPTVPLYLIYATSLLKRAYRDFKSEKT